MIPLTVYPSRIKLSFLALFCLAICLFLVAANYDIGKLGDGGTPIRFALFLKFLEAYDLDMPIRLGFLFLGLLLFFFGFVYCFYKIVKNRPIIEATTNGLSAEGLLGGRLVPWSNIDGFELIKIKSNTFIEVRISHYEVPKERSIIRNSLGFSRNLNIIKPAMGKLSAKELLLELNKRLTHYQNG